MKEDFTTTELKILAWIIVFLIVIVIGIDIGWNIFINKDWRCAFTECRVIINK